MAIGQDSPEPRLSHPGQAPRLPAHPLLRARPCLVLVKRGKVPALVELTCQRKGGDKHIEEHTMSL